MIVVEPSRWVRTTSLAADQAHRGGFYLVDIRRRAAKPLTPDMSRPADALHSACPGAPDPLKLVSHGLSLQHLTRRPDRLHVVNHGVRQSVEVFDVAAGRVTVKLTWLGCILTPPEVAANAVAALPGGLAVSSFGARGAAGTTDLAAGRSSGFVAPWSPRDGWTRLAGSELPGDNGLMASDDGQRLFVNGWGDAVLRLLRLPQPTAPLISIPLGDFHPDSIRRAPDGELLIASQVGERAALSTRLATVVTASR